MNMRNDENSTDNEQLRELLEHAHSTMERIDQHIDEHDLAGLKRHEFANLVIGGITLSLAILVIINLGQNVSVICQDMHDSSKPARWRDRMFP